MAGLQNINTRMNWDELLTPLRFRARHHVQAEEVESSFEKDYQRIIASASFRRLQDKTQVFPLDQSDFVRTRLTHSLEVSALAKAMGKSIAQELYFLGVAPELTTSHVQSLGDVLLAAGLIHDIGNPPFGHYGETTIRDWFARNLGVLSFDGRPLAEVLNRQRQLDFLHFEGNAQALRLLSKLHFLVDDNGMNLSFATLGSILKYPYSSTAVDKINGRHREAKIGYFAAEADLFSAIQEATGTWGRTHPLALVLEAADDISYRTADIEDAYAKGRFSFGQLLDALHANERVESVDDGTKQLFLEQVKAMEQLFTEAKHKKLHKPEQYALQNWLVSLRALMHKDCAQSFAVNYSAIMIGQYEGTLAHARISGLLLDVLGDIAYEYVFSSKQIIQMEIAANTIIGGLLDKFVPAGIDWDTDRKQSSLEPRLMSIISDNYRACYHRFAEGQDEETRLYLRLLLVTDYISGMTDHFAKKMYQQLVAGA